MAAGALGVSTSAIWIDLSGSSPGTATFFRCALALPLLLPLALWERHRQAGVGRWRIGFAVAAGALFAGDALWWTQAIGEVGAGLSTVLVNAQVVLVPLLALAFDREPITRRFLAVLPVMVAGIVLTGGVLEHRAGGVDPLAGTVHALLAAGCYSGFLYLLRRGGRSGGGRVIQNYLVVVATAAVVGLGAGGWWGTVTLTPGWTELAWLALVAVGGQVIGWLLVALATPHLRPEVGAALLLLTPVGALALASVILGQHPSSLQLLGSALVLATAYLATTGKTHGDPASTASQAGTRVPSSRGP